MAEVPCGSNTRKGLRAASTKPSVWGFLFIWLSMNGLVSSQTATPPPNPEKEIQITHKIENRHAILSCIVQDLGPRRIIWSRISDPYPIAVGTTRFHPNQDKYRVSKQVNTNVLTIRHFGVEDAGEYQCRVSGTFPLKEIISLNIQSGPGTTYFLSSNRSIVAALNQTVTLPCKVENLNDRMVLWKDGRNDVISLRKKIYNGDKRFRVLHDTRPDWHLKIEHLQKEDFGFYTCVVNAHPVLTRTIQLINNEPPSFSPVLKKDTHYRKKITAEVGDTVTLTCNFHAYPPPTVKWYKRYIEKERTRKRFLGATGNVYTIRSIQASQAGDYVCIANNGLQEGKGRTRIEINVPVTTVAPTTTFVPDGPKSPVVYYEQQRVGAEPGKEALLVCFSIGRPRPTIHWKRHGTRLGDNHKFEIRDASKGRYTTYSTLKIRDIGPPFYGNYTCFAHNQLGLSHQVIEAYWLKE